MVLDPSVKLNFLCVSSTNKNQPSEMSNPARALIFFVNFSLLLQAVALNANGSQIAPYIWKVVCVTPKEKFCFVRTNTSGIEPYSILFYSIFSIKLGFLHGKIPRHSIELDCSLHISRTKVQCSPLWLDQAHIVYLHTTYYCALLAHFSMNYH